MTPIQEIVPETCPSCGQVVPVNRSPNTALPYKQEDSFAAPVPQHAHVTAIQAYCKLHQKLGCTQCTE